MDTGHDQPSALVVSPQRATRLIREGIPHAQRRVPRFGTSHGSLKHGPKTTLPMNYYYANTEKKPTGPVSFADLQKLAAAREIGSSTPVIREGTSSWSTWGEVAKTDAPASTPSQVPAPEQDATAIVADKVVSSVKSLPIGDALIGILLIVVSFFTTPFTVLVRACNNLAEWGKARRLPTAESEIPVLTYFTVVGRPLAHVLWLFGCFIAGIVMLFTGAIIMLPLFWLAAYFGQLVVGLVCESGSVLVRMANDVNKIAKRQH